MNEILSTYKAFFHARRKKRSLQNIAVLLIVGALLFCSMVTAQSTNDDIHIFGYFQINFEQLNSNTLRHTQNSFSLQQLNLLVEKELSPEFTAFVNFEATNNFSSSLNWGSFSLQEAWVKYYYSNAFNIKAGLLVPEFNNLNEIKNKTPLLPYIDRPIVYESTIEDVIDIDAFVPQQAFLQMYGFVPYGDAKIEYAVYAGNSGKDFINSKNGNFIIRGVDTTMFKMIGGRIGIEYGEFRGGLSGTYDKDNLKAVDLGAVPRIRFGTDVSFHPGDFTVEGEAIIVRDILNDQQDAALAQVSRQNLLVPGNLNKVFYYGLVNYDFTERIYGYAAYNHLNINPDMDGGVNLFSVGGGFRPISPVVLKAQVYRLQIAGNPFVNVNEDHYLIAVSVVF